MRRTGFRSGSRSAGSSGGEQGFWPTYADMMSSVALILFFLMLLSYIQNLITGNDLQNTQELLSDTRAQVSLVQSQLDGLTDDLKRKQDELEAYAVQITEKEDTIASQEKLIGDQALYLKAANEELVEMRNQMQTIAVLRLSILEQIKESIVEVMGDESKVSIGDNGNIILSEGVFFDLGSSDIKPESSVVLNELVDVFSKFLSNPDNLRYVDSIVISGHTDSTGEDWDNRVLSTDRANSVLNYLMQYGNAKLSPYAEYFCAAGYGETRPVASNDTPAGQAANRRIEISMILKDESVLDIVEQYLAIELPDKSISTGSGTGTDSRLSPTPTAPPSPAPTEKPRSGLFRN